jgi:hypothetical protein
MQFQVPQFIEVEDKIFGPFTFQQFIWMTGGAGIAYIIYRLLPIYFAIPLGLALVGLAAALAFAQINGRPFIKYLEYGFYFFIHPRLYLWSNERKPNQAQVKKALSPANDPTLYVPKLSGSKLHDLAWSLDIKERIAAGNTDDGDRVQRGGVFAVRTAQDALNTSVGRRSSLTQ